MPLDETLPTDQQLVAELPGYIRPNRVAINDHFVVTTLAVAGGTTALDIDTDLESVNIEIVLLTGSGAATIATLTGGIEGQIKIIVFLDNNITLTDGVKSDGEFYLNQTALSDFVAQIDDILALINLSGDGSTVDGYWEELWRKVSVK